MARLEKSYGGAAAGCVEGRPPVLALACVQDVWHTAKC